MLSGLYLQAGRTIERGRSREIHALTGWLLANPLAGVTDLIPAYTSLYVEYDASVVRSREVTAWLADGRRKAEAAQGTRRKVTLPVRYDGPDLGEVARRSGLEVPEVIRRHSRAEYHVFAMGFTPGFPFMGVVDEAIRVPRRATPRPDVPAHSLALANEQTGVYPLPSPGGWNLLGTVLEALYDPHREPPFLLEPGNTVTFVPTAGAAPPLPQPLPLLPQEPRHPFLRVAEPGLLDLLVDQGRFLAGRFGLARSGPLDAPLARLANRLLGNSPSSPVVELTLKGPKLEALDAGVIAVAGRAMLPVVNGQPVEPFESIALSPGDMVTFEPAAHGSRSYLAIAGGIESRGFMGSRSVDLKGQIGRPLRTGDVLGREGDSRARAGRRFVPHRLQCDIETVRLLQGPQLDQEALALLSSIPLTVQSADRMGIRLAGGGRLVGGEIISEAAPVGAVQLTPGGDPLILLGDRGTLGGYSKPAIVHPHDLPKLAQLRPGKRLRFRLDMSEEVCRTLDWKDLEEL